MSVTSCPRYPANTYPACGGFCMCEAYAADPDDDFRVCAICVSGDVVDGFNLCETHYRAELERRVEPGDDD